MRLFYLFLTSFVVSREGPDRRDQLEELQASRFGRPELFGIHGFCRLLLCNLSRLCRGQYLTQVHLKASFCSLIWKKLTASSYFLSLQLQIHSCRIWEIDWVSLVSLFSGSFVLPKLMRWAVQWHCFRWTRVNKARRRKQNP